MSAWGTGAKLDIEGEQFSWGFESGSGEDWLPATLGPAANDDWTRNVPTIEHILTPAELPPMIEHSIYPGRVRFVSAPAGERTASLPIRTSDHLAEETEMWQGLFSGQSSVTVPPHTRRRVIVDLENYYCAYHEVRTTGGAGSLVRVCWQESLYEDLSTNRKGHRDKIEGKYFATSYWKKDGIGDSFRPDGGRSRLFESLWWHAGRYTELLVVTGDSQLTIEHVGLRETRYPLEMESRFKSDQPRLSSIVPLAVRTLQMCSHETYMDCPYFEQLMYVGDTRIEALLTYAISSDDRLPRKALRTFNWSRLPNGLTQSRYPSRVRQVIPPFSLWWVAMAHDFFQWRDDRTLMKELLPGVRGVLDYFLSCNVAHDLIGNMQGWNFLDWVPEWNDGVPPDGRSGANSSFNWQTVIALRQAAQLESYVGESALAERYLTHADRLTELINRHFWNETRGLYADDLAHSHYSEHAQCLALLADGVPADRRQSLAENLRLAPNLARATIYFSYYLFEAYRLLGLEEELYKRLTLWSALADLGFKTLHEHPEPSRSDCHAWAAHPLFHYFATILGIRPAAPGFSKVDIAPLLGAHERIEGDLVHPDGKISVRLSRHGEDLNAYVCLPPNVTGSFRWKGQTMALTSGPQTLEFSEQIRTGK
jgi:hypothetical protein